MHSNTKGLLELPDAIELPLPEVSGVSRRSVSTSDKLCSLLPRCFIERASCGAVSSSQSWRFGAYLHEIHTWSKRHASTEGNKNFPSFFLEVREEKRGERLELIEEITEIKAFKNHMCTQIPCTSYVRFSKAYENMVHS